MEYKLTINKIEQTDNKHTSIVGFAIILFDKKIQISNITIRNTNNKLYIYMPQYQQDNKYMDYCHPITKEFRSKLFANILSEFEKLKEGETVTKKFSTNPDQPLQLHMKVDLFTKSNSQIKAIATMFINDIFVINNVLIKHGNNGFYIHYPSIKIKKNNQESYQTVCLPIEKDTRKNLQKQLYAAYKTELNKHVPFN